MPLYPASSTPAERRPVRAVVCDLDHTLTSRSSMVELCRALHAPPAETAMLFRRYQAGELSHSQSRQALLELLRRSGRAHRTNIEAAFNAMEIKDEAVRLATALRERAVPLCLISSSAQLYVDIMTERLSAADGYGNGQLCFDDTGWLTDLDFTAETEQLKADQLHRFTTRHAFHARDVIAIGNGNGNGRNDLLMFDATRRGILVTTTTSAQHAHRAWATVHSLDEVITTSTLRTPHLRNHDEEHDPRCKCRECGASSLGSEGGL
ncbi:HAD-IB family phosphatase (plasmid) [Streptomyces sp. NBC_01166]|uniref:HAD-IB family phosphatase n=1 Tax=Streptomyces sp. NBC_01166 TaxID=2903755 RepID=UPI002F911B9A|nr:HAD-IB family phosphatase [Streptomyces sp. NBC_01166]